MLKRGIGEAGITLSFVPYANLPVIVYLFGVYGIGIFSCIWLWKNIKKSGFDNIRKILIFIFVLYISWELLYDFVVVANVPRFHITLVPFFALMIARSSVESKTLKWIYYITLIYTLVTGVLITYSLHTETIVFWRAFF